MVCAGFSAGRLVGDGGAGVGPVVVVAVAVAGAPGGAGDPAQPARRAPHRRAPQMKATAARMQVAILDAIRGDLGCELRDAPSLRAALDAARVLLAGRSRRL